MELRKFKSSEEIIRWSKAKNKRNNEELVFFQHHGLVEYFNDREHEYKCLNKWFKENKNRNDFHIRQGLYKCDNKISDPDGVIHRNINNIKCTADALISFYTITQEKPENSNEYFEPNIDKLIETYFHYVKVPIFMFPCHQNSINQRRYYKFDDRIDMTLYDIKKEIESREQGTESEAYLHNVFTEEGTDRWIKSIIEQGRKNSQTGFSYLAENVFFINVIFSRQDNVNAKVINLDTNEILTDKEWEKYKNGGAGFWTQKYYRNLKDKIDTWYECQGLFEE